MEQKRAMLLEDELRLVKEALRISMKINLAYGRLVKMANPMTEKKQIMELDALSKEIESSLKKLGGKNE